MCAAVREGGIVLLAGRMRGPNAAAEGLVSWERNEAELPVVVELCRRVMVAGVDVRRRMSGRCADIV